MRFRGSFKYFFFKISFFVYKRQRVPKRTKNHGPFSQNEVCIRNYCLYSIVLCRGMNKSNQPLTNFIKVKFLRYQFEFNIETLIKAFNLSFYILNKFMLYTRKLK